MLYRKEANSRDRKSIIEKGGRGSIVEMRKEICLKDVRAKIFHSIDFLKFLLQSDNELLVPEMQKKLGVTVFVSDIKRAENYPDFDKLAHVIQHGLQWFIVKNIEGESTEANELSLIL